MTHTHLEPHLVPQPLRHTGFTLVEMVIVIAIIGILAAVALPRFAEFRQNARIGTIQSTHAALQTATRVAHAAWLTRGAVDGAVAMPLFGGPTLYLWHGYPDAGSCCWPNGGVGIEGAIEPSSVSVVFLDNMSTRFEVPSAPTPINCSVTYTETQSVATPPVIALVTSGC